MQFRTLSSAVDLARRDTAGPSMMDCPGCGMYSDAELHVPCRAARDLTPRSNANEHPVLCTYIDGLYDGASQGASLVNVV